MKMTKDIVRIENLSFGYQESDLIFDNFSFRLKQDDIVVLYGKIGSGKSTLGKIISGIIGKEQIQVEEFERTVRIPMLLQDVNAQILTFRVDEEIALPLSFQGIDRKQRRDEVHSMLKMFDISDLHTRDPRHLSSGEKQIVILMSILSVRPKFVILDEPSNSLDEENFQYLLKFLTLLKEEGVGMLIIDHNPIKYVGLARRLVKLEKGQIVESSLLDPEHIQDLFIFRSAKQRINAEISSTLSIRITRGFVDKRISFMVFTRGLTLVTGPNGSGKSTLLQMISGVMDTERDVRIHPPPLYLPQDINQFFWQGSIQQEFDGAVVPNWVESIKHKSPFEISTGQQRKVALEIGFISRRNLLLDEPSQGLDPEEFDWLLDRIITLSTSRWIVIASNNKSVLNILRPICNEEVQL